MCLVNFPLYPWLLCVCASLICCRTDCRTDLTVFVLSIWEAKREGAVIHWLMLSKCLQQQGCAQLKPGVENSILVFPVGDRESTTWAKTCHLPGSILAGSWSQEMKLGIEFGHSEVVSGDHNCWTHHRTWLLLTGLALSTLLFPFKLVDWVY